MKKLFSILALALVAMTASAYELTVGTNEHGTINLFVGEIQNPATAEEGQTVTVVITPDEGWAVNQPAGQWYAAMAKAPRRVAGQDIELQSKFELTKLLGQDNTWSFVMGRANVEISVSYKKLLSNQDITISEIADVTYNTEEHKPAITVKDGETTLAEGTDYTVSYSDNTNAGAADAAENAPTVTITAVETSEKYAGENAQTFTILPAKLTEVALAKGRFTYNAEEQTAAVRIVKAGTMTVPADGYDVEGNVQTDAGRYTVAITGKGNFQGELATSFTIDPATLTEVTLAQTEFIYDDADPQPQTAEVESVKAGELEVPAEGYTIEGDTQTDLGTYTVTITGKDNFQGTLTATFSIVKEGIDVIAANSLTGEEVEGVTMNVNVTGETEKAMSIAKFNIPEDCEAESLTLVLPATVKGMAVSSIAAGALTSELVSDIDMPDTDKPITIEEGALPATTAIHTSLSLLDDYALMPGLKANYEAHKVMTTETPNHMYWSLGIGCDIIVPEGLKVNTAHYYTSDKVELLRVDEELLTVDGQQVVRHNNGVIMEGEPGQSYDIVAYSGLMQSGTPISTAIANDYDGENVMEPILVAADYRNTGYYRLEKNAFHPIPANLKLIPAGRALMMKPEGAAQEMAVVYYGPLALDEAEDNSEVLAGNDGREANVTLKRTLKAGSWNTLALPFALDAEMLAGLGNVTVKELSGSSLSNGVLTMTFADAQAIEAGKPYLVKVAEDIDLSLLPFKGVKVSAETVPAKTDDVDFIPTLGKTTVEGDKESLLFLGAENKLFYATELPADMKGFRAYFQLKGYATGAVEVRMELGTETSVRSIDNGQPTMDSIYDLSGRRIANGQWSMVNGQLKKGVYVKSGRKVIVK